MLIIPALAQVMLAITITKIHPVLYSFGLSISFLCELGFGEKI